MPQNQPPYNWQPSSGLAGMAYSEDRRRYEDVGSLQDLMLQNQTQLSLEDLIQGAPVRTAERTAKLKDLPAQSRTLEASTRKAELGTQFEEAMQPGKIKLGMGEQGLAQGQQGIARVIQAIAQAPEGPDYIARIGAAAREAGVPANHPVLQDILNVNSPKEAQAKARAFLQQQSNIDQPYRTTMDKTIVGGEYDLERQRIANQGALASARASQTKQPKTPEQVFNEETNPEHKYAAAVALVNDPSQSVELRQRAGKFMSEMQALIERLSQRGIQPSIPDFPQPAPVAMPNPQGMGAGQPRPQPQQYQQGQVYKGRTGSYRYKGGDPSKKESWEKAD